MRIRIFIDTVYHHYHEIALLQEIKQRIISLQGQRNDISALGHSDKFRSSQTVNKRPF
jgi:hypothetical protein